MTVVNRANARTPGLTLEELEDVDLLELTRKGSTDAYAVLYDRYVYAARRLARHLGQREESDDVVSEAFAQVLDLLQRGKGPDTAFRAYLFTSIRHESGRRAKANKRVMPTDDDAKIDSTVPFGGGDLDGFEKSAIRAAYESLPDRWRTVLWHLDVEGRKPQELAPILGLKPNTVSALVYRARAGLRDAYLQQHVNADAKTGSAMCTDVRSLLAAVIRRTATIRDQEKVHVHLESCDDCVAVYLDLQEVNREVGLIVTPAALAAAVGGAGVLALAGSGGAVLTQLFATVKGLVLAGAAPAAAAVTTVAAVTVGVSVPAAVAGAVDPSPQSVVRLTPTPTPAPAASSKPAADVPAKDSAAPAADSPAALAKTPPAVSTPEVGDEVTPEADVKIGSAQVVVDEEAITVDAGGASVSREPIKDLVETVAPKTTGILTGVVDALRGR